MINETSAMEQATEPPGLNQTSIESGALVKIDRALQELATVHSSEPELQTKLVEVEKEIVGIRDRIKDVRETVARECDVSTVSLALKEHSELLNEFRNTISSMESIQRLSNELRKVIKLTKSAKNDLTNDVGAFVTLSCLKQKGGGEMRDTSAMKRATNTAVLNQDVNDFENITEFERCSSEARTFTSLAIINLIKTVTIDNDWGDALIDFNQLVIPLLEDVEDCLDRRMFITRNQLTNVAQILSKGAAGGEGFESREKGERSFLNVIQAAMESFWFDCTKGATKSPGIAGVKAWERRTERVKEEVVF